MPFGTIAPAGGSVYGRFFLSYPLKHTGGEHERGNVSRIKKGERLLVNRARAPKGALALAKDLPSQLVFTSRGKPPDVRQPKEADMSLTPSTMLKLGTPLPAFHLQDPATGRLVDESIVPADSMGVLVAVICNHCPYVIHIRKKMTSLANTYHQQGVFTLAVNANDVEKYPEDSQANMLKAKELLGYSFPYLFDEQQEFVKNLQAACTPEFYLFNHKRHLVYRGQFDDSRPNSDKPITGADLHTAVTNMLRNIPISPEQNPSIGCNIKWLVGNEPTYT